MRGIYRWFYSRHNQKTPVAGLSQTVTTSNGSGTRLCRPRINEDLLLETSLYPEDIPGLGHDDIIKAWNARSQTARMALRTTSSHFSKKEFFQSNLTYALRSLLLLWPYHSVVGLKTKCCAVKGLTRWRYVRTRFIFGMFSAYKTLKWRKMCLPRHLRCAI